jgi:hypothetical protein
MLLVSADLRVSPRRAGPVGRTNIHAHHPSPSACGRGAIDRDQDAPWGCSVRSGCAFRQLQTRPEGLEAVSLADSARRASSGRGDELALWLHVQLGRIEAVYDDSLLQRANAGRLLLLPNERARSVVL